MLAPDRYGDLLSVLLQHLRALEGGHITRRVRVEAEDNVPGDALQQLGVAVGEGGADGAHHVALPRLVGHHHIHVALYYHRLPGPLYVGAGEIKAVEYGALVEDRRLGRVEVLGHLALIEGPRTEAHCGSLLIAYGEEEAVAEAVVVPTLIALGHQPGVDHLLRGVTPLLEVVAESVPGVGREAYLEGLDGGSGEAALLGIGASLVSGGVIAKEVVVVGGRRSARLLESLPCAVGGDVAFVPGLQFNARPTGQGLQRPAEVEAIGLHEETEGVAARPAAE